jgi:uncharacterized protein
VHSNAKLIEALYSALARRDGKAMVVLYSPQAMFKDPVFELRGPEVGAMWMMLCERAQDLRIEWRDVTADASSGAAHWEAWYTFGATGRPVHNVIEAKFRFRDGLIAKHRDRFDLWRWSRMAFGGKGAMLGWTPLMHGKIRAQARKTLDAWIAQQSK